MTDDRKRFMPDHSAVREEMPYYNFTILDQLADMNGMFTELKQQGKKQMDSSDHQHAIPYYKLALQTQKQFCQALSVLHDLTPESPY